MSKNKNMNDSGMWTPRFMIALGVIVASFIGVFGLSWALISQTDDEEMARLVFTTVMPLIGTWVGTVLAFYFSRENFESASKSMSAMAEKLAPMERLREILARDVMLKKGDMVSLTLEANQELESVVIVGDILKTMEEKKINRLPILSHEHHPLMLIHKSVLDSFLASQAVEGNDTESLKSLTLEDLFGDQNAGGRAKKVKSEGFVIIREDDTLATAKVKMETYSECRDVVVTASGNKHDAVLGWITNIMISEKARV